MMSMVRLVLGELLRVELDDELFTDRHVDLLAQRQVTHGRGELARVHVEPLGCDAIQGVDVVPDHDHPARLVAQRHGVTLRKMYDGIVTRLPFTDTWP